MKQNVYDNQEVKKASFDYFEGDELAAQVWSNKYALKDSSGNLYELSPADMHHRLAGEIARVEAKYPNPLSEKQLFDLFDHFRYIVPQGSPMTGIGNNFQVSSLSNCFVIGVNGDADSYGAIIKLDEEQVQLMKRRGGVGHDLSQIRPEGSPVKNSALTSTGIVPFMERYSNSTKEVAQGGRRGALMLSVSIKHPDSEKFIDAKLTQGKVTGANISVKIDDEFMKAVQKDAIYLRQYPITAKNPKFTNTVKARYLWKKIIHNAWASAEPGVLFWDTIIRESVPDCYADLGYKTVSTNPCGEIPLCPYDSCRLIAINLYSYVENPFTKEAKFNFDLFREHVQYAQRIMDDIIDLEMEKIDNILEKIKSDPEDNSIKQTEYELWTKIKNKTVQGRRTGVGITAEGDMLAALGLRYGSDKAIDFAEEVHKTMAVEAYRSSVIMAKERGAFDVFDAKREENNPFILRLKAVAPDMYDDMIKYGRRNIACLTIAPTGTTSIMTQTTSGIEPTFDCVYIRRRKVNPNDSGVTIDETDADGNAWEKYTVFHHKFVTWMLANGYDVTKKYSDEELKNLVKKSPYYGSTSRDIDWVKKVKLQGRIQKWVDHSISVTVNLPETASEELVDELYREAWQAGCKGVTIYREGSRMGVLESVKSDEEPKKEQAEKVKFDDIDCYCFPKEVQSRPKELDCEVMTFQNKKDKWIAFIGMYNNLPYEIFTGVADDEYGIMLPKWVEKGKIVKEELPDGTKRYDFQFQNRYGYKTTIEGLSHKFDKEYWNYAKLISGVLRYGMPIAQVTKLIGGLQLDDNINAWKAGVIRALKKYIPDGTEIKGQACPQCSQKGYLISETGCIRCTSCGWTKCGNI
ncbi:MAG: adenosylcobalamin-dependent ribonucleoside-diphosphate reductase [Prevotellaceae bacterium]|jgi:ribonucleoside-diphosphate reductase alpha chain|nr:adenosylcobalamin-dependent ribonucleoside-diphosphate reductase [Prevotellaceae bacterium]